MGEITSIAWCDHTWNPWYGCTKVSPGCAHCYAEELMDHRYKKVGWGKGQPRIRAADATFHAPYKWSRAAAKAGTVRAVFALSLGDVYDEEVPDAWRIDMFRVIQETPNLMYLLLTKRPELIDRFHHEACWPESGCPIGDLSDFKNVALGVSIESQEYMWRARHAYDQYCAVTFVSAEPLLGRLLFEDEVIGPLLGQSGINWVITGGESGAAARDCRIENIRAIGRQCQEAKIPWFNKQLGARPVANLGDGRVELMLADKKGGRIQEWPADLCVQESPDWEAVLGAA